MSGLSSYPSQAPETMRPSIHPDSGTVGVQREHISDALRDMLRPPAVPNLDDES